MSRFFTLIAAAGLAFTVGIGAEIAGAAADSTTPGAAPVPPEQQIQNQVYGSCVQAGKLGTPGGELETNCQCEAQVASSILTDGAKQAMANGTFPGGFQGALFKVDQEGFNRLVIKSCPGVRPVLTRQICDPNPDSPACAKLKQALQAQ